MPVLSKFIQILTLLALVSTNAYADDNLQLAEQEIKAGLLYNFLKYTEWPKHAGKENAPLAVCIFGEDPLGGAVQPMATRTVNQRQITVRFIKDVVSSSACDLIFVNADTKGQWPQLSRDLAGKAILTVSDFTGFAERGGMIEFGKKDSHINVLLNMQAVAASGLTVENRLLKLVTVVHPVLQEGAK